MPFTRADHRIALGVAREAKEFARLVSRISVDNEAPRHPAVSQFLNGFQRINKELARGNRAGAVTLLQQARIGRELQKMGAALRRKGRTRKKA